MRQAALDAKNAASMGGRESNMMPFSKSVAIPTSL
jgi:hypothetical protein